MKAPISGRIVMNGLSLHYLEWGEADAAPAVLLHGLCGNAHEWDVFAEAMRNDCRLFALDQRGHGDSDWANSYGPKDSFFDLEGFIEFLGLENVVLIGHSMGGINAVIYAARHPERIRSLVIEDIGPEIGRAGRERIERERTEEPDSFASEEEAVAYMTSLEPRRSSVWIRNQVKHAFRHDDRGRLVFKYDMQLRKTDLHSPEWLWEYVAQVICPTLLVRGTQSDMLTREVAEAMSRAMVACSVEEIEGAGHGVHGDNPSAFEAAVRAFLDETEQRME